VSETSVIDELSRVNRSVRQVGLAGRVSPVGDVTRRKRAGGSYLWPFHGTEKACIQMLAETQT
jgi:hypothetical protein